MTDKSISVIFWIASTHIFLFSWFFFAVFKKIAKTRNRFPGENIYSTTTILFQKEVWKTVISETLLPLLNPITLLALIFGCALTTIVFLSGADEDKCITSYYIGFFIGIGMGSLFKWYYLPVKTDNKPNAPSNPL